MLKFLEHLGDNLLVYLGEAGDTKMLRHGIFIVHFKITNVSAGGKAE